MPVPDPVKTPPCFVSAIANRFVSPRRKSMLAVACITPGDAVTVHHAVADGGPEVGPGLAVGRRRAVGVARSGGGDLVGQARGDVLRFGAVADPAPCQPVQLGVDHHQRRLADAGLVVGIRGRGRGHAAQGVGDRHVASIGA